MILIDQSYVSKSSLDKESPQGRVAGFLGEYYYYTDPTSGAEKTYVCILGGTALTATWAEEVAGMDIIMGVEGGRWEGHTEESLLDDMVVQMQSTLDQLREEQEKKLKIKSHDKGETE